MLRLILLEIKIFAVRLRLRWLKFTTWLLRGTLKINS